jgi:hypothetical protein
MRNVRSHQSRSTMPGVASTAATISAWCSTLRQLTTMSRSSVLPFATNPSTAKMLPPASPIDVASRPSTPGTLSR